jgi:hypothetical protein
VGVGTFIPYWFERFDLRIEIDGRWFNMRPGGTTRGAVENTIWECQREICCHVRSSEVIVLACVD